MMELPKKIAVEARIKPNLRFLKEKHNIATDLNEVYPSWKISNSESRLINKEEHNSIQLTSRNVRFSFNFPKDLDAAKERIASDLSKYMNSLSATEFERIGVRFLFLKEVSLSFDELRDIMQFRLFKKMGDLSSILTPEFTDLAYVVDFIKDGFKYHFKSGPVRKKQTLELIPFEVDDFEEKVFSEKMEKIPEVNLFSDIDCYKDSLDKEDLEKFIDESFGNCMRMFKDYSSFVMEEKR